MVYYVQDQCERGYETSLTTLILAIKIVNRFKNKTLFSSSRGGLTNPDLELIEVIFVVLYMIDEDEKIFTKD